MINQDKSQLNISDLQKSNVSRRKRLVLMKAFRRQNQTEQLSQYNLSATSTQNYILPNKSLLCSPQKHNQNQKQQKYFSESRVQTQITTSQMKKINIFQNQYIHCLKSGFSNAYLEQSRIRQRQQQPPQFQGPIYNSQIDIEPKVQFQIQNETLQQQVYKFDRNPKFMKFKVSLKRNSQNPERINEQSDKKIKRHSDRVLITQLKTQQSCSSVYDSNSHRKSDSQKNNYKSLNTNQYYKKFRQNKKAYPYCIPKLNQKSNLFKSIKIFQRKQSLLGQIEQKKDLALKQPTNYFQLQVRDRYKQIQRKHDFTIKIQYNKNNQSKSMLKNSFIDKIQQGRFDTNFKYQQRQIISKIRGKSLNLSQL